MNGLTTDFDRAGAGRPTIANLTPKRLKLLPFFFLCTWCGLVAGLLEVGATAARKQFLDVNRFYWTSRHFVWLAPLADLAIFLVLGFLIWCLAACFRRRARWLAQRLLCLLTFVAIFWAAFPRIYGIAGVALGLGIAVRLVPALERRDAGFRRFVWRSFPVVAAAVPILFASVWGQDRIRAWRGQARPLPAPGSASALLIVLEHRRRRSPLALRLPSAHQPDPGRACRARRALQARMRATSSWTLPSHASMFTGRWPHELSAGWLTPLDDAFPTLAEYLGQRGYATAGFAANYSYCAADSGLARGFAVYHDYVFPRLTALRMGAIVDRTVDGLMAIERFLGERLGLDFLRSSINQIWQLFKGDRKDATMVSSEFLSWLSQRRQLDRPFFAFLNFYDAHSPYQLPATSIHRFRRLPRNNLEADLLKDWTFLSRLQPTEQQISLIRDAYDDCVTDLDERLGCLVDELESRGVLAHTWLIVTADHGESFGEHPDVYRHGTTLYETEVQVPLVIIPPGGGQAKQAVGETVSLRDLPATIVDVLGVAEGSPFPGSSLARLWKNPSTQPAADPAGVSPALSEVVPLEGFNPDPAQLLTPRWPLAALSDNGWNYIRRDGELREELFYVRVDAGEQTNLAGEAAAAATLERLRQSLRSLTAGPLTPDRFNR